MLKRILLFEDDEAIAELCSMLLTILSGYDLSVCRDTVDVLSRVRAFDPDLIIMDDRISGIGGVRAIQLLKSTEVVKSIPVILFTANNNVGDLARLAGADAWIAKPFSIDTFSDVVSKTVTTLTL